MRENAISMLHYAQNVQTTRKLCLCANLRARAINLLWQNNVFLVGGISYASDEQVNVTTHTFTDYFRYG